MCSTLLLIPRTVGELQQGVNRPRVEAPGSTGRLLLFVRSMWRDDVTQEQRSRGKQLELNYELMLWLLFKQGAWCVNDVQDQISMTVRSAYRHIGALVAAKVVKEVGFVNVYHPRLMYYSAIFRAKRRDDVEQARDLKAAVPPLPYGRGRNRSK